MSEELIEKIAKAIKHQLGPHFLSPSSYSDLARAALAAIEASGTHVVVPVEPTDEMTEMLKRYYDWPEHGYREAIAARPKVAK